MLTDKKFIRDPESKAISNTDIKALNKYKEERRQRLKQQSLIKEQKELKHQLQECVKTIGDLQVELELIRNELHNN